MGSGVTIALMELIKYICWFQRFSCGKEDAEVEIKMNFFLPDKPAGAYALICIYSFKKRRSGKSVLKSLQTSETRCITIV
jgi:hypothetical protein